MVGIVIAFIILAAAMGVFVQVRQTSVEGAARSQLARDAQLLLDQLGRDLHHAGLGVPSGTGVDNAAAGQEMRPAVRRLMADNLVFFGDLPFPNAELPGIATVAHFKDDAAGASGHRVVVISEVSGRCAPAATGASPAFQCATTAASLVPASYTTADDCKQTQTGARTCPWAMNKWLPAAGFVPSLVFVDADGEWYPRQWAGLSEIEVMNDWIGIHLVHTTDRDLPRDEFVAPVAAGYVAHIDRVYWSFESQAGGACPGPGSACVVRRRQCWGDFGDPNSGDSATSTSPLRSSTVPGACSEPTAGTPWELVAPGVETFTLTAFQDGATALADPVATADLGRVRAIEARVTLAKDVGGRRVEHTAAERFFLEHRDQEAP